MTEKSWEHWRKLPTDDLRRAVVAVKRQVKDARAHAGVLQNAVDGMEKELIRRGGK